MVRRLVLVTILTAGTLVRASGPAAPPDLDGWIARAMQTFEVPGIAVAVVKDDVVVVAKGYGAFRFSANVKGPSQNLIIRMPENLASSAQGATASGSGTNQANAIDEIFPSGSRLGDGWPEFR